MKLKTLDTTPYPEFSIKNIETINYIIEKNNNKLIIFVR